MDPADTLVQAREEPPSRRRSRGEPEFILGRYRLLERLGSGGFGTVWRARDETLGREVALKRVPVPEDESAERAAREALAAARLGHPAIVSLYEACADGDAFILVSELVRGETLAALIADDVLADDEIAQIGIALADALSHAHARGVIHRDLKPANVLVPDPSDVARAPAKLADFGGARLSGEQTLTRTGDVVGTLAYMSPEQAAGEEVGETSDLYSLALVLYEAFAGVNPVRGATPAATARRLGSRLAPLGAHRRDLPPGLTRAIDTALDSRPRRRGSLDDFSCALREALEEGLEERPPAAPKTRPQRVAQRPPQRPEPLWDPTRVRPTGRAPSPRRPARPDPERLDAPPAAAIPRAVRVSCGLAAGALAAGAVSWPALAPSAPVPGAAVAGLVAALAVALAPRLGWAALAVAACAWAAAAGHGGTAVLVLAATAVVPALLRRPGPAWSAPALAPVLGALGLAAAFPALAAQTRSWPRRAALGALGYWWLRLAEPPAGHRLWLAPPARLPNGWSSSASAAISHAIVPLLDERTLAGVLVWSAAAAVLPVLVRGASPVRDVALAAAWAGALLALTPLTVRGADAHLLGGAYPRGAIAGACVGAAAAVALAAYRRRPRAGPL